MLSFKKNEAPVSPDLLDRLKRRERDAQEQLWKREHAPLKRVARSIVSMDADAENLVSDALSDFFYFYVDQVRESRAVVSYLKIMIVRRARRHKERQRRQRELEPQTITHDPSDQIQTQLDSLQHVDQLNRCLDGIPLRSRKILKLHYGHDLSYSAISEQLGVTKQAIGKTVTKCLEALKQCLEEREGIPVAQRMSS